MLLAAVLATATAPFGFGNKQKDEHQAGSIDGLDDIPDRRMKSDVDLAMDGWAQLAKNPDKIQEIAAAMKDPEVIAKAHEMLKDPQYMAAAQAKVAELQAKAQAKGMLDENGQPVAGGMGGDMAGLNRMMEMMGGGGGGGAAQPRDWELENIAKHQDGGLNTAELGYQQLQGAMKDPSVMAEVAQMMRDPENVAKVKQMMSDPAFMQQAKAVAEQMKASGQMPNFAGMQQAMQGMQQGGMDPAAAEIARLRAENQRLRQGI